MTLDKIVKELYNFMVHLEHMSLKDLVVLRFKMKDGPHSFPPDIETNKFELVTLELKKRKKALRKA